MLQSLTAKLIFARTAMDVSECIGKCPAILMEGALGERLKREYHISFDENVAMAGLMYEQKGREALSELWNGYVDIARRYGLPFLATTPTRRANRDRIALSRYSERIIGDNVRFLRSIQEKADIKMYVGGLMGCRGDAYTAEGALSEEEAYEFHTWTAERFWEAEVDFLYAGIMPSLPEAAGLAKAASDMKLPYIVSFTVQGDGRLIDGTSISDAIRYIDSVAEQKPIIYMSNCIHPRILFQALSQPFNQTPLVRARFRGIQANASPLSYAELDNSIERKCSEPEALANEMIRLSEISDIKIWGGCCGTDNRHMECLARKLCL